MASTFPPAALKVLAVEVAELLKTHKQTVCVAETAAGGLISASLLSTPGASSFFKGGLTLYTLESRVMYAGWTQQDIDRYRGPTKDIVADLAEKVRKNHETTYCVSESGTAGPSGGKTRNRTPGYVALAVATRNGSFTREVETGLGEDREANMVAFASEALKMLKEVVSRGEKL